MSVGPDVFGEDYLHFYETWLTDDVSDRQAELLWRLLDLHEGSDVLDLACGHGRIANRLATRGARVTGLDADAFFVERARAAGTGAQYLHGDMRALPWSDARFDAVVLWFTALPFAAAPRPAFAAVVPAPRRRRRTGTSTTGTRHMPSCGRSCSTPASPPSC